MGNMSRASHWSFAMLPSELNDFKCEDLEATWKWEFKLTWREAGPPNHHGDIKWIRTSRLSIKNSLSNGKIWTGNTSRASASR